MDMLRDRKSEFATWIMKKKRTNISNIVEQVLAMYAKGMTTRDIAAHLKSVYGVDISTK